MKDIGVDIDIVEDGKTFEENAVIKRKQLWKRPVRWFLRTIPVLRWII